MDVSTLYRRCAESWATRVAAVRPEHWQLPTPCEEWSVRDLVNHLAGEDLWTVPLMRGATLEEVGDRFDGDVLGDDPARVALDASAEAESVVLATLPAGGKVHLSYGEEEKEEYVSQLSADHLIHSWDLAVAIGADAALDPDAVAEVAAWFAEREEGYRSAGLIGPRLPAVGNPQGDLLAAFGRHAGWRAKA